MDNIQERIKQVFEALNITTYQVAKDLDENPSKFYNIMNGRAKPSYDTIMNLLAHYPQIRADFLLRGMLPILDSGFQAKEEDNGRIIPLHNDTIELPFVPIKFYATFIENHTEGLRVKDLETYPVKKSVVRSSKQAVVIEIAGNSMSPQLVSGAKVLAEYVDRNDWEYQSGGIYAVMYRDFFVVKRIKDNELLTKKQLSLHSDHPNGGSVTVALNDIRGLWKVVNIVDAPVE